MTKKPRINLILTAEEVAAVADIQRDSKIPATTAQILHALIALGIKALAEANGKGRRDRRERSTRFCD